MRAHACRALDKDREMAIDDILYFAGELDNIEFVGEEHGLGLVTQVRWSNPRGHWHSRGACHR